MAYSYKDVTLEQWVVTAFMTVFLFAAGSSFIFRGFRPGVPIMILAVGLVVAMLVRYVFKREFEFNFGNFFTLGLVVAGIIAFWIFFRGVAPEIFSIAIQQTASVIGLGG